MALTKSQEELLDTHHPRGHGARCYHAVQWPRPQLGPLDHIMLRVEAIQVEFVYEMPTVCLRDGPMIPVDRLRRALCRLLDYDPHLTGRLHFDPNINAPEIISYRSICFGSTSFGGSQAAAQMRLIRLDR
jgi:hypothetical protein